MTQIKHTRGRFAGAVAGVAVLATVVAGCGSSGSSTTNTQPSTGSGSGNSTNSSTSGLSANALALHDAMRALWETHGQYTELAIVDAVAGNPDTTAVVARLQQNQTDIGNAIKPFYGDAAGNALADLLHQHISTAVAAVGAAKSGNTNATNQAVAAFKANGEQIAEFLNKANPNNWSLTDMQSMMNTHLTQVVDLAVDQVKGDYTDAIQLYNAYIDHILNGMADMLTNGIIAQFPDKFSGPAVINTKVLGAHDALRALWEMHGFYTERAISDAVSGNPETTAVVARLQQNQDQIGAAVQPFYGNAGATALANLLHAHISTAVAAVVAAKSGNTTATNNAVAAFKANGQQIAVFLNKANPDNWSLADMQSMMSTHLTQVVDLAVDQIKGNYQAAIQLYNAYIDHILVGMADMLSNGIVKQFPSQFN